MTRRSERHDAPHVLFFIVVKPDVLARELRQASAARKLGSLGLVGGAWK